MLLQVEQKTQPKGPKSKARSSCTVWVDVLCCNLARDALKEHKQKKQCCIEHGTAQLGLTAGDGSIKGV